MTLPAETNDGGANPPGLEKAGASLALELRERDLEARLRTVRRRARWKTLWAFLGVSPTAIIPALGLLREGNIGLLILLGFLVTLTQGISGAKAAREAEALEKELDDLRGGS